MEAFVHPLPELFAQLGLASDENAIRGFLAAHAPLAQDIALADAPFWSPAQASFLNEQWLANADWAEVIEQLNAALRPGPAHG